MPINKKYPLSVLMRRLRKDYPLRDWEHTDV